MLSLIESHVMMPARLTRQEAAAVLGVSPQTLQKLHKDLPYFQPARTSITYSTQMVRDYLVRSMRGGWDVAEIGKLRELEEARCQVAELNERVRDLEYQLETARRAG